MSLGEIVGVLVILFIILFPMVRYRLEQAARQKDPAAYYKKQREKKEAFQEFLHSIEVDDDEPVPARPRPKLAAMTASNRRTPPPVPAPVRTAAEERSKSFHEDLRSATHISSTLVKRPISTEGLKLKTAPLLSAPLSSSQPPMEGISNTAASMTRGTRLSPRGLILGREILLPPLALRDDNPYF